jgi:hypothetical protein
VSSRRWKTLPFLRTRFLGARDASLELLAREHLEQAHDGLDCIDREALEDASLAELLRLLGAQVVFECQRFACSVDRFDDLLCCWPGATHRAERRSASHRRLEGLSPDPPFDVEGVVAGG